MIRVETEHSTYLFDDERALVRRQPQFGGLRRDEEWIRLLDIDPPTVGEPMRMILDLRGDGVVTFRETSPVTSITE